jgi:hypothetical protein
VIRVTAPPLLPHPVPEEESEEDPEELEHVKDSEEEEEVQSEDSSGKDPSHLEAMTFCSTGTEGGDTAEQLCSVLVHLGFSARPDYHVTRVTRHGCFEWGARVFLYNRDRLVSTHHTRAFRSSRGEAIADEVTSQARDHPPAAE